jgi:hypothetical protein
MTDKTPCDLAIEREKAALQALSDRQNGDVSSKEWAAIPVNASLILTGKPTTEDLEAEVEASAKAVEEACRGQGPSR